MTSQKSIDSHNQVNIFFSIFQDKLPLGEGASGFYLSAASIRSNTLVVSKSKNSNFDDSSIGNILERSVFDIFPLSFFANIIVTK